VSLEIRITRDLFVPRELVFDAWTQEEHLLQWYSPSAQDTRRSRLEPRPGGRFALAWESAGGATEVDEGELVSIRRPDGFECLLGTSAGPVGRLTVKLLERGGTCRIDLLHDGFASPAARDRRQRLWLALLDRLEAYFAVI
jgi:uncharacterized protein YndB with AHSA1/START domain